MCCMFEFLNVLLYEGYFLIECCVFFECCCDVDDFKDVFFCCVLVKAVFCMINYVKFILSIDVDVESD